MIQENMKPEILQIGYKKDRKPWILNIGYRRIGSLGYYR